MVFGISKFPKKIPKKFPKIPKNSKKKFKKFKKFQKIPKKNSKKKFQKNSKKIPKMSRSLHLRGGGGVDGLRTGGVWTAETVKRPPQQPAQPQYANHMAPLTRKRHIPPDPAQPRHTNHWAPRTRKRHQQEPLPQRPTESSDPTQHAKGRTGDCPGPRKETTTRRNVTQAGIPRRLVCSPRGGCCVGRGTEWAGTPCLSLHLFTSFASCAPVSLAPRSSSAQPLRNVRSC